MTAAYAKVPKKLRKSLKKVIKKQLAPAKVVDVRAAGYEGVWGDPLLMVYVIFEELNVLEGLPDPNKRIKLRSLVLPLLEKAGDSRSPVFRLRSKDDMSDVPV